MPSGAEPKACSSGGDCAVPTPRVWQCRLLTGKSPSPSPWTWRPTREVWSC